MIPETSEVYPMSPVNRLTRAAALAVGLAAVPAAHAAPATEDDAGGVVVFRSQSAWESAGEIARAVKVGDGRPTLIEFYANHGFT
jgi:hypothetical protein